jgi:hypothetical protein
VSAAQAPGPEELAGALAAELTRARQRGLDRLDLPLGTEGRVAVPQLDDLARWYTGDRQTDHFPLLSRLLRDALAAWARQGHPTEARTVQRLFFAPDGGAPGRTNAGHLYTQARLALNQSTSTFEKHRRLLFREFAPFLIDYVIASVATEVPAPSAPAPDEPVPPSSLPGHATRRRRGAAAAALALAVVAAVVLVLRQAPPTGDSTAAFRFDALRGGSAIVNVYPGVQDTAADRQPNGTFLSGQTTTATCKTTGRLVRSDPSAGERPRQSAVWLRVAAQAGQISYASLTYGDIDQKALAVLPPC